MSVKNCTTSELLINALGNLLKKIGSLFQLRKIITKLDNCHFYGDQSALDLWR